MESIAESEDQKVETKISFMDAIKRRYIETCVIPEEVLHLPQMDGKDRTIELIGFEKSFERLIEVNVSQMNISFCDNESQSLKQVLSHTKTLILSHNLLTDWSEVATIVRNVISLTDLILSCNKLMVPTKEQLDYKSFEAIKTLVIDNIDYDFNQILFCAQMWPNIKRLDVWGNRITELRAPELPVFKHLNHLSLCNNNIEDWNQILKLGSLPLQTLNVCDCNLNQIQFNDSDLNNKTKLFQQLESLLISNNKLLKWRDVSELNKLEKLENLLIRNNPVLDNEKYDINFNLVLSRIANLKCLNREMITESMRRDAEIGYLRKMFKYYETIKTLEDRQKLEDFMSDNPRFETILTKFGTPFGCGTASKDEIESKMFLTINIRNPFDEQMKIKKKIPASISIINLKTIIRKLFDIDFSYDLNLLWTSKNFECPLDKESQNLNYYSIENEDTILVNIE